MKIFLHENLSYESFFTRKFPDLRYVYIYRTCMLDVRSPEYVPYYEEPGSDKPDPSKVCGMSTIIIVL